MLKSLLSLFAVLGLWTAIASAQDATPEKAKTGDAQFPGKKPVVVSETPKPDDGKPGDKKPVYVRRLAKTTSKASPTPAATPVETPTPKKGFFSRVFGAKDKETPKPVASPAATPTPRYHRRRPIEKNTDSEPGTKGDAEKKGDDDKKPEAEKPPGAEKPDAEKKPDEEKKVETSPDAEKKPGEEKMGAEEKKPDTERKGGVETPIEKPPVDKGPANKEVAAVTPAPMPTPASSRKNRKGKMAAATPSAESSVPVDPETAERNRFDSIKAKALEDPQVQELKTKADSAATEEEGKKALKAYNKALFAKMRKLDGSLRDRIDIMEGVILKRLEE